eukprot:381460-Rhodomonas_salina.1
MVSRAGIHQTLLLMADEINKLQPGLKRRQLEAALDCMWKNVIASRRDVTSQSDSFHPIQRSVSRKMVMCRPRPHLKILPPRETHATPAPPSQDPILPPQASFPSDSDMTEWIWAIDHSGAEWSSSTPCYGTVRCTAVLYLAECLPVYNTAALLGFCHPWMPLFSLHHA